VVVWWSVCFHTLLLDHHSHLLIPTVLKLQQQQQQ